MDFSDQELINAYLKGDEKSLEILVSRYIRPIYSFIYRYTKSAVATEDLTQEVFVKIWRNLKKFDQKRSFKTWIFTIAKNTVIDFFKKKKEILFSEFEDEEKNLIIETIPDPAPLPPEIFEKADLVEKLNLALDKLSPSSRIVLFLHHNDHLSFKEIAEILQEPIDTVISRYKRAILN